MKLIYLAGGCFWGVEEFFSRLKGVADTEVGYANGHTDNPTYEDVKHKETGFAETLKITFDDQQISLDEILKAYWSIVDPTVLNRQANDIGTQYRTGIYYTDENDFAIIEASKEQEQQKYDKPIVTEIEPLKNYYPAEEYHQDYLKKNPGGYCHLSFD